MSRNVIIYGMCNQCEDELYPDLINKGLKRDFAGIVTRVQCIVCYGRKVDLSGQCVDPGCSKNHGTSDSLWGKITSFIRRYSHN